MQTGSTIYIKGMVCERCMLAVRKEFNRLHMPVADIKLGEVTTVIVLSQENMSAIEQVLRPLGFTLLENKRTKLVRELKALVEQVYSGNYDFPHDFRFSDVVVSHFHNDYELISRTFSLVESMTLEKYVIAYRIEKVKELLVYTSATLADIAFKLGFSSAAHLARQFKSETGLTPSHFRKIRIEKISASGHNGPTS